MTNDEGFDALQLVRKKLSTSLSGENDELDFYSDDGDVAHASRVSRLLAEAAIEIVGHLRRSRPRLLSTSAKARFGRAVEALWRVETLSSGYPRGLDLKSLTSLPDRCVVTVIAFIGGPSHEIENERVGSQMQIRSMLRNWFLAQTGSGRMLDEGLLVLVNRLLEISEFDAIVNARRADAVWLSLDELAVAVGTLRLSRYDQRQRLDYMSILGQIEERANDSSSAFESNSLVNRRPDSLITESLAEISEPLQERSVDGTDYPVWFGTDRAQHVDRAGRLSFQNTRVGSGELVVGKSRVFIPFDHRKGSVGPAWWHRVFLPARQDGKLRLLDAAILPPAMFRADVRRATDDSDSQRALVYVHGYNTSFEEAVIRAAQIGYDLRVPGIMAAYSWPSRAKLRAYFSDREAAESSEESLEGFLNLLAGSGVTQIDVIAHSMGNQVLLRVVDRIQRMSREAQVALGRVVLAAPDVDATLFGRLAPAYVGATEMTTIYVSRRDRALQASGWLRDHPRAGFVPPLSVIAGIDTVSVGDVDLSALGHGYYASHGQVLHELREVLVHGTEAPKRSNIQPLGDHWELNSG